MSFQAIAVTISVCITAVATVAYMVFQQRRYSTNNPNATNDDFSVYPNEQCPICLENMDEPGDDTIIVNCGHHIHRGCLMRMDHHRGFLSTNWCPICRTPIRFE